MFLRQNHLTNFGVKTLKEVWFGIGDNNDCFIYI